MSQTFVPIKNNYASLPGSGLATFFGLSRAYLGPNHLLCLRIRGASEFAHRFYFADITGLRCRKTRKGWAINVVLLACGLLPWVLLAFPDYLTFGTIVGASVVTTFFLLLMLINIGLGATCATYLHTTNHTERLPSLGRYRTARKAMARLHERISEVQGAITVLEDAEPFPAFSPVALRTATVVVTPPTGRSRPIEAAFYVSFFLALSLVIDYRYHWDWKNAIDTIAVLVMSALAPAALIRACRIDCGGLVRVMAGILVVFFVTLIPMEFVSIGLIAAFDPSGFAEFMENSDGIASLSPADGATYYILVGDNTLSILMLGVCGLTGLLALRRQRRSNQVFDPGT